MLNINRICALVCVFPVLQVLDDCIFAFFAVEMVIKMVALGIFGPNCYLGDKWNQLDFVIVMAGLVSHNAFCAHAYNSLNFLPHTADRRDKKYIFANINRLKMRISITKTCDLEPGHMYVHMFLAVSCHRRLGPPFTVG